VRTRQLVGVALVAALVVGILALRPAGDSGDGDPLAPLRKAVGIESCPAALGTALPKVTLPCLDGGRDVAIASGAPGKPMLVNIWATWCRPCVEEVPLLLRFREQAGDRVGVVGVLHEDEQDQALEFARQYGMHYPSVVDPDGQVLRKFSSGPPVTLLIDANGKVKQVKRGEWKSLAELQSAVAKSLGLRL
jgi:cytochrome c biogenesis protein CcmG, thiol:disulfide interchange protein DsbE